MLHQMSQMHLNASVRDSEGRYRSLITKFIKL